MNTSKKIISLLMCMLMVLTMAPMSVFASNTVIDEINLTYDADKFIFNTALTGKECNKTIHSTIGTDTTGITVDTGGNSYLQNVTTGYALSSSEENLSAENEYAFVYTVWLDTGYDWIEGVKSDDYSDFTVKVNGIVRSDIEIYYNNYWNLLEFAVPLGSPSSTPIVTDITVSDNVLSVAKGENHTFTADVKGTVADKTVTWSVEGAASAETVIDTTGKLTVGTDETAETVTVKATANADSTKFATATVTVTEQPPYVSGVDVSPSVESLYTGAEKEFTVNVYGTQTDKSVTWTVEGATSAKTTIDNTGKLTIGSDETAATLTVKATANKDNTKFGTSTVTVKQKTRISEINLTYDVAALEFTTLTTGRNSHATIHNTIGTDTVGVKVIQDSNSYLENTTTGYSVKDSDEKLSAENNYAFVYCVRLDTGYDWIESVKSKDYSDFTVKVNGVVRTDIEIDYNDYWNLLDVSVPLGKPTCPHTYDNDCDAECNLCPEIRTVPHVYDNACDAECNNCPATRTPAAHKGGTATCKDKAICSVCGEAYGELSTVHTYDNACDAECNICKAPRTPAAHKGGTATCTAKAKCSVCGKAYGSLKAHSYKTVTTKATLTKNGKTESKCSCGAVKSGSTKTVYYPKTIKLEYTSATYNGKTKTPSVSVKDYKGNKLKKDTDYTVKYASGRKSTGKYSVTITFKGKYSGTKTLYFNILPSKTSKITPACSTTEIKASWSKVTGASGYKVELLNSKGKVVKKVTTTKTSYTFKKLSKVTTYKIRVTAYKTIDKKAAYSTVSTTITTSTAPAKVTLSKVTAGSKAATPAWKTVSGASGYQVQYSTSSKFKSAKTATVSKGSSKKTTIKKLTKGKKYYFKVRAYKTVGSVKVYGAWSSVKSVKVK